MIAHKFKHVISDDEKAPVKKGRIPISSLVFGSGTFNPSGFNTRQMKGGIELRNLYFVVRDCIGFLRKKV
jgi:hypothetical protein